MLVLGGMEETVVAVQTTTSSDELDGLLGIAAALGEEDGSPLGSLPRRVHHVVDLPLRSPRLVPHPVGSSPIRILPSWWGNPNPNPSSSSSSSSSSSLSLSLRARADTRIREGLASERGFSIWAFAVLDGPRQTTGLVLLLYDMLSFYKVPVAYKILYFSEKVLSSFVGSCR